MEEDRENPWNFHTCKFCPYRSKSTFLMCKEVRRRRRSTTDTFSCNSKIPENYECEFCNFDSNLKVDLTEHIRVSHKEQAQNEEMGNILKSFKCENCKFDTHSLIVLARHDNSNCKSIHSNNSKNEERKKVAKMREKVGKHFISNHTSSGGWLKCDQCNFKTRGKDYFNRHYQKLHINPVDWINCAKCTFRTRTKSNLKDHNNLKHGDNPENIDWFACEQCSYKCKIKGSLKAHLARMHFNPEEVRRFQCAHCEYANKHKKNLIKHIKNMHTKAEATHKFICGLCRSKFKIKDQLKVHIARMHTKQEDLNSYHDVFKREEKKRIEHTAGKHQENWFECYHCGGKFKTKKYLKAHMLSMHRRPEDAKWFECAQCEFKSKKKKSLAHHVLSKHTARNQVECPQCGSKFAWKSSLKVHLKMRHANSKDIKWFKCRQCVFKSKDKSYLRRHIITKHIVKSIDLCK